MLRSPLLALLGVIGAAAAGSAIGAIVLLLWAIYCSYQWWQGLVVYIDGAPVLGNPRQTPHLPAPVRKTPKDHSTQTPQRRGRREEKRPLSEGFRTPRSESVEGLDPIVEWAPFAPSFPLGEPPEDLQSLADTPFARIPEGAVQPYWLQCDACVFDVRSVGYKQTREKVASQPALYQCVGMDIVRDHKRIDCILERFSDVALPPDLPGAVEWSTAWAVPRVLIFNCQVPYTAGRLFGSHPEEDGGLSILNYFVISQQTASLLAEGLPTPPLRLLQRFVEEGVSTKEGISLKVVGRVEDLEKHQVPESFKRFNNKPVLLTRSSTVYTKYLPEVLEIDFDVRSWNYPTRTAMTAYQHRAREAEVEIGYLLEGKVDEELPEQILGCFTVNNMDIMAARWLP